MPAHPHFTEQQIAELENAYETHKGTKAGDRIHIVMLVAKGKKYEEIRKISGCSKGTTSKWVTQYFNCGLPALVQIKKGSSFSPEQIKELETAYETYKGTRVGDRLFVVFLFAKGKTCAEIKKITGCAKSTTSSWVTQYLNRGLPALIRAKKKLSYDLARTPDERLSEIAAVESVLKSTSDAWEKRRLSAILLCLKSTPLDQVMSETGYGDTTIKRLVREYRNVGLEKYLDHEVRPYGNPALRRKVFAPQEIAAVTEAYEGAAEPRSARRYKLILLRMQGMKNREAAKETGMAPGTASTIFCAYLTSGLAGVRAIENAPNARWVSKFTKQQKWEIHQAFINARRLQDKAVIEILVLRAQGKTYDEIHEITGFGIVKISQTVKNYLAHGLPKSPHGGG